MTSTILASFPSPDRGVWHIGVIPIRAYALCIIVGIVAALVIGDRRWAARGGQRGVIYDIALWAVPFGLVGGRLYHVMTDWPTYFGPNGFGFLAALRIWDGGLGIWGAVALGAVGAWIGCRHRGIPLPAFGDAIAPGIILAQAIGRLGNYFNQELYGGPTGLPWGLEIFYRVDPSGKEDKLNGVSTGQLLETAPVPVHPTFLYELLWNLLVFAMLLWADRRFRLGHGRLFALYVAGYCVGRFGIELLRQDHASLIAGIRVNTFTSAIVFLGAVLYIVVAAKGREAPEKLRGKSSEATERDAADEPEVPVGARVASTGTGSVVAAEGSASTLEPEAGLGSVDGDEVGAAEGDAATVHDAAVDGVEDAEATADDVADEPATTTGADEPVAADAETNDDETTDDVPDADPLVEETTPEAGLGSVDGDEVGAAEGDAATVHDAAVDGVEDAEATADDVADEPAMTTGADEPVAADADPSADSPVVEETTPEAGLGSVDGDEVGAAEGDAATVHDAAVDGVEDAEATADDVADEPATTTGADEPPRSPAPARRRRWRRGG